MKTKHTKTKTVNQLIYELELLERVRNDLSEQLDNLTVEEKISLITELNDISNDAFDNLQAYYNDEEFFTTYFGDNLMAAIRAAHFGNYSYNDVLVRFNGYGNLESLSLAEYYSDFNNELDDIVDFIIDNREHIDLENYFIDTKLLDKYLEIVYK